SRRSSSRSRAATRTPRTLSRWRPPPFERFLDRGAMLVGPELSTMRAHEQRPRRKRPLELVAEPDAPAPAAPAPPSDDAPAAPAAAGPTGLTAIPLLNRELSWIAFNDRVLDEAFDERWPLLERLKFLAISPTNL